MIFIDRLIRYSRKDIYLPLRCYAKKKELFCKKQKCDCKIFCKKPPNGSTPVLQEVYVPQYKKHVNLEQQYDFA